MRQYPFLILVFCNLTIFNGLLNGQGIRHGSHSRIDPANLPVGLENFSYESVWELSFLEKKRQIQHILETAYEDLEATRSMGNPAKMVESMERLAKVLMIVGDYSYARKMLEQAKDIRFREQLGMELGWHQSLLKLGMLHLELGNLDSAWLLINEANRVTQHEQDSLARAYAQQCLAAYYLKSEDWEKASPYLNNAQSVFIATQSADALATNLRLKSTYFLGVDSVSMAMQQLMLADSLTWQYGLLEQSILILLDLSEVCESAGKYQEALNYRKKYHQQEAQLEALKLNTYLSDLDFRQVQESMRRELDRSSSLQDVYLWMAGIGLLGMFLLIGWTWWRWKNLQTLPVEAVKIPVRQTPLQAMGSWEYDLETQTIWCSSRVRNLLGWEEARGQGFIQLSELLAMIHPDDLAQAKTKLSDFSQNQVNFYAEYRLRSGLGEEFHLVSSGLVHHDFAGMPKRVVGAVRVHGGYAFEEEKNDPDLDFFIWLFEISQLFVRVPTSDIDDQIVASLKDWVDLMGVDRGFYYQFDARRESAVLKGFWIRPQIPDEDVHHQVHKDEFPSLFEHGFGQDVVSINDIKELEPTSPERLFLTELYAKSGINIPLFTNSEVSGFIWFDVVEDARNWSTGDLGKFRLIGELFSNALLRKELGLKSQGAMVEGLERERQRIAEHVHDGIGPMLSTIKLYLDQFSNSDMSKQELWDRVSPVITGAIDEMRSVSHDLSSSKINQLGLVGAIKEMAYHLSQQTLKVNFQAVGLRSALPRVLELSIFRIVQELLNNVVKHAGATSVDAQVIEHESLYQILVEDNGKGFSVAESLGHAGIGLSNIEYRTKALNGKVFIDSRSGYGTMVLVEIPK
ncbi:ATP-binding protein [Pontibacter sp. G13]|uniref:ATP-binding protein n=1 Tax=Pontibacter sp. G13 TaxID=3074898 RepID=UPI00288AB2A6|nr:ATP-binding protein [Pontibacter sp. G13]WNJ18980.1 PAS domain-containing protein [Pontibacter sp. G13]